MREPVDFLLERLNQKVLTLNHYFSLYNYSKTLKERRTKEAHLRILHFHEIRIKNLGHSIEEFKKAIKVLLEYRGK